MKRQIFYSVFVTAMSIFLASLTIVMGILYHYFSNVQKENLKTETSIAVSGVEHSGTDYLEDIKSFDHRITWIAPDGTVLFDNKAISAEMENHLKREEIIEAIKTGVGESSRYSTTLTERQHYCAKKLSDGSVLRLASNHLTWWALIISMLQPIIAIVIIALILSVFLAYRLANRIVKPLNGLDLQSANTSETYKELEPLFTRISAQQKQLNSQAYELMRKKEEFDAATENMREGIILLGESGNILSINKTASRIFNISRYCIGKDLLIFNNTFEIQELLNIAKSGEHTERTVKIDSRNYQINASPITTDGKITGIALIIFDITEKEKGETARREFTANVSHELKTPLQNISGYAELLANNMVKPEDVPDFSKRIFSESKRLISLIEDIIQLSHLDEGLITNNFETVDLFELAKLTHGNLLCDADKKHINFAVEGEHAQIKGVPSLLSEIMYNLCDNAIKYNIESGNVKLSVKNGAEQVVLTVSDTGIGIPPEEQSRIFERFYRVDKSHSKKVGGTGLGLSITKHAAIIHRAEIEVSSEVGRGTEFKLFFPKNL